MPFRVKEGEEAMKAHDEHVKERPCTLPRPSGNGGAGCSESDGQIDSDEDSDEELQDVSVQA
jgi:hypothetical protein